MFSPVESERTKRAVRWLVASSIIEIKYNSFAAFQPNRAPEVSHCTISPGELRRGRHS